MKTATVGEIQKNFSSVLNSLQAGEKITVTKRGKPVAIIRTLGPKRDLHWPDFYSKSIEIKGKEMSDIVIEGRADRL